MALQFEPGNGGGVIERFEAVSPKDRFDQFIDLFARDPRLEVMDLVAVDDRFDVLRDRVEGRVVSIPVPTPPTPAPTPTPIVMNLIAEPSPETRLRQTLQSLLAPILAGGGFGGGTGRALPLGTAGTRLVAAPPARSPLVTILILAGIAGVGYYLYQRYRKGKAA